ncbi:hypothetical protein AGR3A_Cc430052 [Agrobacterium tomkonis CFBP 6623]|uniref:Uncharacterized protein n=1 Tax=Agrobacterium tomkonis CFBP 6623 TaxID=1183432 RepID=A0A1S7QHW1_9HYPH|nr:hypothetical protein AGR3A_Cc430052 [Agrobacterium tomkonis CFBP 6623]
MKTKRRQGGECMTGAISDPVNRQHYTSRSVVNNLLPRAATALLEEKGNLSCSEFLRLAGSTHSAACPPFPWPSTCLPVTVESFPAPRRVQSILCPC